MVSAGNELSTIFEANAVCGLDDAPVRQDPRFHVATIPTSSRRAVDFIPDTYILQLSRASVGHQNRRFTPSAVDATMLAALIRVERLRETDVRRLIARDDALIAL